MLVQPTRDPERIETEYLKNLNVLQGKKVLEIGSGNGRLTQRLAPLAHSVIAIDPDPARLAEAHAAKIQSAHFLQAGAERLPFPDNIFDTAVFAWSL
jgi:ubiquinone/menaquinone biosynthesis C-methylase UbiE